jgi:phage shock protein PspC (stress-responsive transcriptional regulator)
MSPQLVATAWVLFLYLGASYLGVLFYCATERWTR